MFILLCLNICSDRAILKMLAKISGQVNRNTLMLQAIQNQLKNKEADIVCDVDIVEELGLPLKSEVDFQKVASLLDEPSKRKNLVCLL